MRCQLGEVDALDELVAAWHERLWRYVRTLLPNDEIAGEAVQNVWLRILRGLPALRDPARFSAWSYRIAHGVAMDHLRAKYADQLLEPLDEHEESAPEAEGEPDRLQEHEELEALHAGLTNLPVLERNVLSLFYLQELSLVEIAAVTAVPLGTVKSRLFRARRMLRRLMEIRTRENNHV